MTAGYHLAMRLAQYNAIKPGLVIRLYDKHYKNLKRAGYKVEDTGMGIFRVFLKDKLTDSANYVYQRGWITTCIESEEE